MPHLRHLVAVGPANRDHLSALRVGLSVAVPSLLLLGAGHPELIIYAVFGAFTGMYGRDESHQLRLRHQGQAAGMLLTGVTVGAILAAGQASLPVLIGVEAVLAALGSLAADRAALKPAGPFFGIFALGACASVPPVIPWWGALLICAGSAGFAVLVGFIGWVRHRAWVSGAVRSAGPLSGDRFTAAAVHAARYFLAVAAAGLIGLLTGAGHTYWAMAAAAVPLAAADTPSRIYRGIHRVLGTFAGLGITAVILQINPGVAVVGLLVVAFQFPTELFMARHYGLAMMFFTPLILLMTQLANPGDPRTLIIDRGIETFIGAAVGVTVVLAIGDPGPKHPGGALRA